MIDQLGTPGHYFQNAASIVSVVLVSILLYVFRVLGAKSFQVKVINGIPYHLALNPEQEALRFTAPPQLGLFCVQQYIIVPPSTTPSLNPWVSNQCLWVVMFLLSCSV